MIIRSSQEMLELGEELAKNLIPPVTLELVGDVGAGKTTFTQGLAKGLGIHEEISSPSFTVSKRYALQNGGELVHYDFYRLDDPGIMRDELEETLSEPKNIAVIEWGENVADLFGENTVRLYFSLREDGGRDVKIEGLDKS